MGNKAQNADKMMRKWKLELGVEQYLIDGVVRDTRIEEKKAMNEMKKMAKIGQHEVVKEIAKNVLQCRKSVTRLYKTKAQLKGIEYQMNNYYTQSKMMNAFKMSTAIVKRMNGLMNMNDISDTMRNMKKEMEMAEVIDGTITDIIDESLDTSEDEVTDTVEKVLVEVVGEEMAKLVVSDEPLPNIAKPKEEEVTDKDDEIDEFSSRLNALTND